MGKAMVPISVIADLVCQEMGDNTGGKKFQVLQYIALGWQQMHLFLNQDVCIKTECIPYDRQSIELPCDFIYETKVGLKIGDRICTLSLNTGLNRSFMEKNDTDSLHYIEDVLSGEYGPAETVFFYNSPFGILSGYGSGFAKNKYYSIQDGMMHFSTFIPQYEKAEVIIEYKSDGLSAGLTLVPSEAFLALKYFAHAQFDAAGPNGANQLMYESQYKTLKRLYNFRSADTLVELFAVR